METHLVNSAEDQYPPPDSVDLQQTLGQDSPKLPPPPAETLDEDQEVEDIVCASPINSYSGQGCSSFDDTRSLTSHFSNKKLKSSSLVGFEENPSMVGAGLSNLGNTCFLNAILQCFTHTVPLLEGLRSCDHVTPCDGNNNGFCLLCSFRGHVEISLASVERIICPWKFVDNLSYFSSSFQKYEQEDAHEFLQCFLDRLESSSGDSNLKEITSCVKNDNFVKRAFGGRLVSKLKCCSCGHHSDTHEPMIDLSLEIEDVTTLQAALDSFTKLEKIEDLETKFVCENCKEEVSIEKQLLLEETPSVAAMHLKRFKNDGSFVEKIDKFVEFPLELDLQPYTKCSQNSDVEMKYELYAIVVHTGFSATSGHYYSFIRSAPDTWYKFDDSKVVRVQEKFVLSQDAYILFYAKQGMPWFSSYLETIKPFLDPHRNSTSPKSVLDNVDVCALSPNHATTCKYNLNETSNASHAQVDGIIYKDDTQRMSTLPPSANYPIENTTDRSNGKDDKTRGSSTLPPGTSVYVKDDGNGMKVISPSVLQEYILNQDDVKIISDNHPQTPPRSYSPDIYRDESPEVELHITPSHHKLANQVSHKKGSKKKQESLETKQAFRLLKTVPGSKRRESLLAAMGGSFSDDTQKNKQRRRMQVTPNKDDSPSTTNKKAVLQSLVRPLAAGYH